MNCVGGEYHTITLSDDGVVYSFGVNMRGELGLGHNDDVSVPSPNPYLPKINQVACGPNFTVCIDFEGFLWSFGKNNEGQLGTGNTKNINIPQKIRQIPPVYSVACGNEHTLIITNDSDLWACGSNKFGQLCLGKQWDQTTRFQKTSFSDISRISTGFSFSLFENNKGEIYLSGTYDYRFGSSELANLRRNRKTIPTCIPNLPSNIVQFVCGYLHSLFLDSEGNVYSIGCNQVGQLGLNHKLTQIIINQIHNLPPIHTISCVGHSSYLLDYEGNLWSFGDNACNQLGIGNAIHAVVPTKVESLKDIKQISYGYGSHFLAKNLQDKIFVIGHNGWGQLAIESTFTTPNFTEMDPKYFSIWGESLKSTAKSARK